jgi:hypothetical protein
MRFSSLAVVVTAIGCLCAGGASAFDGKRSGFVLGFGAGAGWTSFTRTVDTGTYSESSDRQDKLSVGTDFKIGAGIGDRFLLYYVNRVAWFQVEDAFFDKDLKYAAVGLLGASYYFGDASPSFYLLGLVGTSNWVSFDDGGSMMGFGVGAGAGWEFTRHWSVEATVNWGNPGEDWVETSVFSFLVTLNGLAY